MSYRCFGCRKLVEETDVMGPHWHQTCYRKFDAERQANAAEDDRQFNERNASARRLYLVTEGEYSDYKFIALFSTAEKAQEWIDFGGQGDTIEEMLLDPPEADLVMQLGLFPHWVRMTRDGATDLVTKGPATMRMDAWQCEDWYQNITREIGSNRVYMYGCVLARDDQHAVKIVNEKRVQLIASGAWDERERDLLNEHRTYKAYPLPAAEPNSRPSTPIADALEPGDSCKVSIVRHL